MTAIWLVLATALLMGALHAFDPDHLAAVTAFITRRPSRHAALGFALRWGLGHSATLIVVAMACALFRLAITADIEAAAEAAVGLTLIGVGLWVLAGLWRGSLRLEPHAHEGHRHTHLHRPGHGTERHHHAVFWIGALHGLAGSAGLLVIVPIALMESPLGVLAYVITFSFGVTAAMMLYALAAGGLLGRIADGPSARWYPWLAGTAGCFSLGLGVIWIARLLAAPSI
jgi:ABC-type nickel/cobalt efflux system permease component RcnA